jgi:Ca2+-binding RTX toxin-like protein
VRIDNGVLEVTGDAQSNDVRVTVVLRQGVERYRIAVPGSTVNPGSGCRSDGTAAVTCRTSGVSSIDVNAGNGNDSVTLDVTVPTTVRGGNGNDTVNGGNGNDRLNGQNGNDRLIGGPGTDAANGGNGRDQCQAETEVDCEDGPGPAGGTTAPRPPRARWAGRRGRAGRPIRC